MESEMAKGPTWRAPSLKLELRTPLPSSWSSLELEPGAWVGVGTGRGFSEGPLLSSFLISFIYDIAAFRPSSNKHSLHFDFLLVLFLYLTT